MQIAVNIENANPKLVDVLSVLLSSYKGLKYDIKKNLDYSKLEKEIRKSEKELEKQRKNGTLKTFNSVDEMFEDIFND